MNILAFVIGLLMIFAITTNTLLKKKGEDSIVSKSFSGYMKASRNALNEAQVNYFSAIKEVSTHKNSPENNENTLPKKRTINTENAKINIYHLSKDIENQKDLYNLTTSLIKTLYSNKSFYKKNLEHELISQILKAIENQSKDNKNLQLANLILKNDSFQKTYYKILKGTKFYDFEKNIGSASLLDFIKFENSNQKIPMKDASKELLLAAFNEKIVKDIQALQIEDPPKNLTQEMVLIICQKHHFYLNEKFLNLFDFSTTNSNNNIVVGVDNSTNIKVKRKIY